MKFRFKPEDFETRQDDDMTIPWPQHFMASKANALLEAHEKTLERIAGTFEDLNPQNFVPDSPFHNLRVTHTALLYDVEEIKGEEK